MKNKIEKIGELAKLKFTDSEMEDTLIKFQKTLDYISNLEEVDTENVEPLYRVFDYPQVLREDLEGLSLSREDVLINTVEKEYGFFKLMNIMD